MTSREGQQSTIDRLTYPVVVVLALVITAALLPLAQTEGDVGPGTVSVQMALSWHGETELEVPPLGSIRVDSHEAPSVLRARVERIDLPAAAALADDDLTMVLSGGNRTALQHLVWQLAGRVLALAALAGLVAGLVVPRRSWRHLLAGISSAVLVASAVLVGTWRTYSTDSFESPTFDGALERAPEVLDAVQREYESFQGLRDRLDLLAGQITVLSAQAASPGSVVPGPDDVRILHISDVHLNPIGLEFAAGLAEQFDVDAIVDTGDLTSFGLPYESEIGRLIQTMPVPYYLVPGNHDSPTNRRRLAQVPNLTVLDRASVSIRGVVVLGVPDPATSVAPDEDGVSGAEARQARLDEADFVLALTRADEPDVLAVAGLQLAADIDGEVPLVISGDIHERSSERRDDTLLLTVGTTGAGGLGRFTVTTGRPYSAEILRFVDGRLVAYDYITIDGLGGGFTVDRVVVDAPSDD